MDPAQLRRWNQFLRRIQKTVRSNVDEFKGAALRLTERYSEQAVRDRRKKSEHPECLRLFPGLPASAHQIPGVQPGTETRLWRTVCIGVDLRHENPDLSTRALDDPLLRAQEILLFVCLVNDRECGEYLGPLLDLALMDWSGDNAEHGIGLGWNSFDDLHTGKEPWRTMLPDALRVVTDAIKRKTAFQAQADDSKPTNVPPVNPVEGLVLALCRVHADSARVFQALTELEGVDRKSSVPLEWRFVRLDQTDRIAELKALRSRPWAPLVLKTVEAVHDLRNSIDGIPPLLPAVGVRVDDNNRPEIEHWTVKLTRELRALRTALRRGETGGDLEPSELPLLHEGVPAAIQEKVNPILERISELKSLPPQKAEATQPPRSHATATVWVRADEAATWSGLSPDTIRKRARREQWPVKMSGMMNCYPLDRLTFTWPNRQFWADNGGI